MSDTDPESPEPPQRFFVPLSEIRETSELDEALARLEKERADNYQALAGTAALPERERTEARARIQPRVDMSEIAVATYTAIRDIHAVAQTATREAQDRAAESAKREASMVQETHRLLLLTRWLVGLATLTLAAAIVTLIAG